VQLRPLLQRGTATLIRDECGLFAGKHC